jgi:hypothetical protein
MLREAAQSRDGSHAASEAALEAEDIPRQCRSDPWDQVALAKGSVAASVVGSAADSAAVTEATVASVAAATLVVVAGAGSAEASVAVVAAAIVTSAVGAAAAEAVTAVVRMATRRQMRLMALVVVVSALLEEAVTGEISLDPVVGMAVREVAAHLMTGPEATEAIEAIEATEAIVAATETTDKPEATWSRCALVASMDTEAAETTIGPETMTAASVATRAATRIPGSCVATNRTIPRIVLWWVCQSIFVTFSSAIHPLCHQG